MFHGTAHVVLGSGMTIAGATFCLSFTRLPYFQSLGVPLGGRHDRRSVRGADLGPRGDHGRQPLRDCWNPSAPCAFAGGGGWVPPSSGGPARSCSRRSRSRWSACSPCRATSPTTTTATTCRADLPANAGFAAAERHFSVARMNPELLLIESDHDLRNSADFLVIDKIAKAVFRVPGIGSVQAITRPSGKPVKFSTIPAQLSKSGVNADDEPQVHGRPHGQHAGAGRRHADHHRHDEPDDRVDGADERDHPRDGRQDHRHGRRHRRIAGPHLRFRRFLPPDPQLLLLGTALLRHPGLLRRCARSSTRSTASTP